MTDEHPEAPRLKGLAPIIGHHYRVSGLSTFERVLLANDGAFTVLLEALRNAPVDVVVSKNISSPASPEAAQLLGVAEAAPIWRREVFLVEHRTGQPLVYACSLVDPSIFDEARRDRLLTSTIGLDRMLASMPAAYRRELLGFAIERGGRHLEDFSLPDDAESVCRSSRLMVDGATAALVTEKFPRMLFRSETDQQVKDDMLYALGPKRVLLGLGANLGDRRRYLVDAVLEMSRRGVLVEACSAIYETSPVGMKSDKTFANAVIEARFEGSFDHLLSILQEVERGLGRNDRRKWTDRVIDIDILFAGETILNTPKLQIPHPLAIERPFVMTPLLDVRPDTVDPETGRSVRDVFEARCGAPVAFPILVSAEDFLAAVSS